MESNAGSTDEYYVLTVREWLITLIIISIPIVNIIMLLVWAFSDSAHITRKNFSQAYLLLTVIVLVFIAIMYGLIFAVGAGMGMGA